MHGAKLNFFAIIMAMGLLGGSYAPSRLLAASGPAFVQGQSNQVTSGKTVSVTFPSANTAGDLIAVYVIWSNTSTASVSDSRGNTYVSAASATKWSSNRSSAQVFYAKNVAAGANTVTATFATSVSSYGLVYVHEYSGLDTASPLDATAAASGTGATMNSGSATTKNSIDLLFGAGVSSNTVTAGGPSYTVRLTDYGNITEDRIVSAAGTYNATATHNGNAWAMQMVAFKAATSTVVTAPTISSPSLTFSSQTVGTTSAAQTVTLTNTAGVSLNISSIAIAGTNAGDFAQTNTCGSSVAAGGNCTISVTFTPTAAGTRTASVAITDNASGSPQTVSLSGTGTAALVSLSTTSLTFSSQTVGTTSAIQTVTLNNTGSVGLSLTSITITGTNAGDFGQTNNCGNSVAAGGNCTISVTFTPTAAGTRSANLAITDNATGSPQTVSLSGTGSNPVPVLNSITPTSASAGTAAQTLTITGTGFVASATATYNGVAHTVSFVGSTQITITLSAADQSTAGTYAVVVTNPAPGGGASNALNFTVTATNPVPTITNLSPASAPAGAAAQTLTINGTGFVAGSTVTYNGVAHTVSFVSSTQLTITLSAADQSTAGLDAVVVTNPTPGGGASNAVYFTVTNPSLAITFVQSGTTGQTSGQTASKAFASSVTSGDLIIVGVFVDVGAPVSVSDSFGDTFTQVVHQTVASDHDADVLVATARATGANTVKVNAGSGKNVYAFSIHEYSGATTTADAFSTAQGSGTSLASGNMTTANPNDLIFAWFTNGNNFHNEYFPSLNSAYTKREMSGSGTPLCNGWASCVESGDFVAPTTVTTNATATLNASDIWSATVVAFKGAASGGTGTGAVANVSPTSLVFDSQAVGTTSTPQVVTLNNTGNDSLNITGITVAGTNAGDFAQTNTCGSSVAAGASCTISVTFTPTAAGTRAASVSITDNASGSPQIMSLTGTGTGAAVSLSPGSLTFASQTVGTTSAAQTITVSNVGNVTLNISALAITDTNASDFSQTNNCQNAIEAGGNCTISVTFTPSGSGMRTATLRITDNGPNSPQSAGLSGSGGGQGFVLPVKASANERYLVDQNDQPWLMIADAAWEMMGTIGPSDMAIYMANRQARGFNSTLITFPCAFDQCPSSGAAFDGTLPFTSGSNPSNFDLSTPNNAYWSEVDNLVNLAASYGLVVLFDPSELYGMMQTFRNNGPAKCYSYGAYLGNRYKNFPNIIWLQGNDFQTWSTSSTDNNLIYQIMLGIASADPKHLQTIELNYWSSYANQDTLLNGVLNVDSAYTYYDTYDCVLQAYASSPTLPAYLIEGNYEGENNTGALPGPAGPYVLREQAYWTMTSGGVGQIWGNRDIYKFDSSWKSSLDSPGALQIAGIDNFFGSYPWWNLVPDCLTDCNNSANHAVLVGGFGTYDGNQENLEQNNYCSTGWTTDGTLAIIYCPGNTNPASPVTLTVNMSAFSGPMRARWYDPSNGTTGGTYIAIAGSPFANSGTQTFTTPGTNGTNSGGDQDWVLVLDEATQ